MSRLSKLLRNPGPFLRDWLLKRHPLDLSSAGGLSGPDGGHRLQERLPASFPIDVVYTWVDHRDEQWREQLRVWRAMQSDGLEENTAAAARFEDHEELRYSLRSLHAYAPWVRHIHIVTAGHLPSWLDTTHPQIRIVPHCSIIDAAHLPTFNSHVIEAHLHRIEGLSEHYLYLNDDVMFARPLQTSDFFLASGIALASLSQQALPPGPPASADTPTLCASKNVRRLVQQVHGVDIKDTIVHGVHAQRRSAAAAAYALLQERGLSFYGNRFRAADDYNVATLLSHYLSYFAGTTIFATSSCMYFNMQSRKSAFCYRYMLDARGKPQCPDVICANQVDMALSREEEQAAAAALHDFLEAYYPRPSPYER